MTDKRLTAIWPYVLLWLLQLGDIISTALVISSGNGFEGNPVMRATLEWGFLGYAFGLTLKGALVYLLYRLRHRAVEVFNATLIMSGVYLFVVGSNLSIAY